MFFGMIAMHGAPSHGQLTRRPMQAFLYNMVVLLLSLLLLSLLMLMLMLMLMLLWHTHTRPPVTQS